MVSLQAVLSGAVIEPDPVVVCSGRRRDGIVESACEKVAQRHAGGPAACAALVGVRLEKGRRQRRRFARCGSREPGEVALKSSAVNVQEYSFIISTARAACNILTELVAYHFPRPYGQCSVRSGAVRVHKYLCNEAIAIGGWIDPVTLWWKRHLTSQRLDISVVRRVSRLRF